MAFTPGYLGGGTATGYEYQLNGGAWVSAGTPSSPITITGLADGTTYSIALRADSTSGTGRRRAVDHHHPDVPGAPTVSSIAAGDRTMSIDFTPGSPGGRPSPSYQYQLTSGGPWTAAPRLPARSS